MGKGVFITFEGIEACGKTTQSKMLFHYLIDTGYRAITTREPGGTSLGIRIREILLSHTEEIFPSVAELMLYEADRNIHINNVIKPKLNEGYIVISDRFYDSTTAYQHYARGIDLDVVFFLNSLASENIRPDITFLIDIPVEMAFERLEKKDRLESEGLDFHNKVRNGFLEIARREVDRFVILDGMDDIQSIFNKVKSVLKERNIIR